MVSKEIIIKTFDNLIENKCTVTLKQITSSIEPIVKRLTDTQEEYDTLMDSIPRFYRDHYNLDHEELYAIDNDGTEYTNTAGDNNSVEVPEELVDKGISDGVLLAMHNHPIDASCIQSDGDFAVCVYVNEKYMVTVANDGVMITKNNTHNKNSFFVGQVRAEFEYPTLEMFYTDPEYGFTDIVDDLKQGKISQEEANKRGTKIMNDYYTTHMDSEVKRLNKTFQDYDLDINVNYVKVK